MALSFFDFIKPKNGKTQLVEVECKEMASALAEYRMRELCFEICANMVANAIGRCEFRTFRGGEEIFENEHYLWNYEPNINQNSTMFLHKLVHQLYEKNEVLIIETRRRDGKEALVVADEFEIGAEYPARQNEYKHVTVGDVHYEKTFRENEVLRIKLNNRDVLPVVKKIAAAHERLIKSVQRLYAWAAGQHLKVHVDQIVQGEDGWAEKFSQIIQKQIKPFFDSENAVLPEFDGYKYEEFGRESGTSEGLEDMRNMIADIFNFTARGFGIPAVLVNGTVEGTEDAMERFLSGCVDPLCDQLQEEITRKRYGYEEWRQGNYLKVDSSAIIHFDIFKQANNIEKLIGSGAFTINDVLRAAGREPLRDEWADRHWMTLNIGTMNDSLDDLERG